MNNKINSRLVELRAKALFTISLTARDDLAVEEVTADSGYDFIIRIVKDGSVTNRMFAAELKAAVGEAGLSEIRFPAQQLAFYKDIPFPVCLFFFSVSNDKGYYRWLVEPTLSYGKPGLAFRVDEHDLNAKNSSYVTFPSQELIEMNADNLERIVDNVNDWYDQRASLK